MDASLQAALAAAALVLVALLVGAALPVLFEARTTLRQARRILTDVEPRVRALAHSLDEMQQFLKVAAAIGASVGPAVSAAVRAYQSTRRDGEDGDGTGGTHGHAGSSPGG